MRNSCLHIRPILVLSFICYQHNFPCCSSLQCFLYPSRKRSLTQAVSEALLSSSQHTLLPENECSSGLYTHGVNVVLPRFLDVKHTLFKGFHIDVGEIPYKDIPDANSECLARSPASCT